MNFNNLSNEKRITLLMFGLGISMLIFVAVFAVQNPSEKQNLNFSLKPYWNSLFGEKVVDEVTPAVEEPAKPSVFAQNLEPIYEDPERLYFENHSIDIPVIHVGVEADGKLENPEDWGVGGWFYNSARPGEHGNIIINAHYDDNNGAPAAFWQLKNVSVDDKVFLVDTYGKIYAYTVTERFYLDINDPDRLHIFEDVEGKSELTLITCGGVWDYSVGTYNKRLVVKAELAVEEAKLASVDSTIQSSN